jgi:DNA polymerase-4
MDARRDEVGKHVQRIILHVDMDAFYASIEQRDEPSLRGKPVVVGGAGRRGVVATASYEARRFGVHSAMPMAQARRLCPQAVVVSPRMEAYLRTSEQIMEQLATFSPLVEPLSLDEAFLDMTGASNLFGPPDAMARQIVSAVRKQTELSCSVGIGSNKFLAKLASDLDKPGGVTWIPFDDARAFIAPLPIRKLWGVGPRAADKLERVSLSRIGDVAAADRALLDSQLGTSLGGHVHHLAHGIDDRPVVASRERKSVGAEQTLEQDIRGFDAIMGVMRKQCERVAEGLRKKQLLAAGVRVKLRYSETFRLATRQAALPRPCDDSRSLIGGAQKLLERLELDQAVRLVGAAAYDLRARDSQRQLGLFGASPADDRSEVEHTIDAIRERFGDKIEYGSD